MKLYVNVSLSYHGLNQLQNIEIISNIPTLKPSAQHVRAFTHIEAYGVIGLAKVKIISIILCVPGIFIKTRKSKLLHRFARSII